MNNPPFELDHENWIYILNDDDRKRFAPKLATDEYWLPLSREWTQVQHSRDFQDGVYYRRRKTSGWVSVKERLPEANQPIYVTSGEGLCPLQLGYDNPENIKLSFTHWQPWTLPALPQPPKPAAEVAFEQFLNSAGIGTHALTAACKAWKAGIAWAKDHKGAL